MNINAKRLKVLFFLIAGYLALMVGVKNVLETLLSIKDIQAIGFQISAELTLPFFFGMMMITKSSEITAQIKEDLDLKG
jgi:hypothetical protein